MAGGQAMEASASTKSPSVRGVVLCPDGSSRGRGHAVEISGKGLPGLLSSDGRKTPGEVPRVSIISTHNHLTHTTPPGLYRSAHMGDVVLVWLARNQRP